MITHPNILKVENSLLLVIDIQKKLVSTLQKKDAEQMLTNSTRLLVAAEILDIPIVVTEQYPKGLGPTDPQITNQLADNVPIIDKTGFSCCSASDFIGLLNNKTRKQIIIIGLEAHVCVLQTALELLANDYQVYIVEDALCSRNTSHKFYAIQRMQQQGATISCYESVLFEWLKNSRHLDFKAISKLIR